MNRSAAYLIASATLVVLAVAVASVQTLVDPHPLIYSEVAYTSYNNFVIFRQSFYHLVHGLDLYARYAAEHADFFKYSPSFALFMGVFRPLSPQTGVVIWNLLGAFLILWGLRSLVPDPGRLLICVVLLIPELHTTALNIQSNAHIAGLLMFSFAAMERGKTLAPAAALVSTAFVKLFGMVLAPVALMYSGRWRMLLMMFCTGMLLAIAPAFVIGFDNLAAQYQSWLKLLQFDHEISLGISLAGLLSELGGFTVNKQLILILAAAALLCPLLRLKQFGQPSFRGLYFVFCLLWMVLLNHKAESPTFIIVMCAVAYYGNLTGFRGFPLFMVWFCFVFTSLSVSDLVPREIRHTVVEPYRLKALAPSLLMIFLWFKLMLVRKTAGTSGA